MAKNIFATITHVAEKIAEAITGHNGDTDAHPTLTNQINVLSGIPGETAFGIKDLNGWMKTGVYSCSDDNPNRPPNASWGVVSISGVGDNIFQFYTGQNQSKKLWLRSHNNIGWTDWEPVATTTEMDILSTGKLDKSTFHQGINVDTFDKEGTNRIFNAIGKLPEGMSQGDNDIFITIYPADLGWRRRTLLDVRSNKMYLGGMRGSEIQEWELIATTSKTDISLLAQWTREFGETVIHKNGNECTMTLVVKGGVIVNGTVVFNIPPGFRPKQFIALETSFGYAVTPTVVTIEPDGRVVIGEISTNERLFLNLRWNV